VFQVQGKGTGSRRSQEHHWHTKIGLPSGLDVDALFLAQRPQDQINQRERTTAVRSWPSFAGTDVVVLCICTCAQLHQEHQLSSSRGTSTNGIAQPPLTPSLKLTVLPRISFWQMHESPVNDLRFSHTSQQAVTALHMPQRKLNYLSQVQHVCCRR
jgi:hypothetical protein